MNVARPRQFVTTTALILAAALASGVAAPHGLVAQGVAPSPAVRVAARLVAEPAKVTISLSGADATLTWSGGALQQSDSLNGTYTEVTGAVSPLKVTPIGSAKFYRVR